MGIYTYGLEKYVQTLKSQLILEALPGGYVCQAIGDGQLGLLNHLGADFSGDRLLHLYVSHFQSDCRHKGKEDVYAALE